MTSERRITTGPNFSVEERSDGIAIVRVWRRPDLSRDEGARCAILIAGHMQRLARSSRGCIFDLTGATTSWGPETNQAVGDMLAAWEAVAKLIYIVPANEAIQRILLLELQRARAPRYSKLAPTRDAAVALLTTPEPVPARRR
jgi:hypothetical protein